MKAAILQQFGKTPQYGDFPEPVPENEQQIVMTVKAASIKQQDKAKASGNHYTSNASLPAVVGFDGAGVLDDGRRVYAMGLTGMLAEKALIDKDKWVPLPDNIDFKLAAALPNMLLGSDMALLYRGGIKRGDVILINGATGVTGMVATQVARLHGASKVIVTGRNPDSLRQLKELGADETISLKQDDELFVSQLTAIQNATPIDIVLDYIWGHPIELILSALGGASVVHPVKIVSVGEMAGATIALSGSSLRSHPIEILGSGFGSMTPEQVQIYMKDVLPSIFNMASEGKIKIDIESASLKDVEEAWTKKYPSGVRVVVEM